MQRTGSLNTGRARNTAIWCTALGVWSLCGPTEVGAQQIAPNPNPVGNTITIGSPNALNGPGVDFENLGDINIIPGGKLTNDGDLFIDPVGRITNEGTLENNNLVMNFGLFENTAGGQLLTGNGTFINEGVLTNDGNIVGSTVPLNFRNEGVWQGNGSLSGQFQDIGDLAPGTDGTTGVLTLTGNYSKDGGRLLIDLAGSGGSPGVTHDRVDVSGGWSFAGTTTLEVQLDAGYVPRFEDNFILGSAATFDGFFTNTVFPMTSDPGGFWEIAIIGDSGGSSVAAASVGPTLNSLSGSLLSLTYSTLVGDMNFNGVVNDDDVEFFAMGLNDPAAYEGLFTYEPRIAGDLNVDGVFNFSDIEPFVGLLSPSSAAQLQALIPEPGTAALLLSAGSLLLLRSRDGRDAT